MIIKPYISATNNIDNPNGLYYSNEDNQVNRDSFEYLLYIEYGKSLYHLEGLTKLKNVKIVFTFIESVPDTISKCF